MVDFQVLLSKEAVAVYALAIAALEKKFQFIKPAVKFIESHKSIAHDAGALIETEAVKLLHSPHVAELEAKLAHVESEQSDTKLAKLAGDVLRAAKTRLDAMTADQKTGYALVISTEAKKLGLTVTQTQITDAMAKADKVVDDIASLELFKSTQSIDAPVEPATPAQA